MRQKKPLVGVNHVQGHIAANYITHNELKPPFLCVMMSGGNTQIIHVKDYTEFEVLGKTRDDAIGEAFDKVARVVGLGYPGGPKVDKLALQGEPNIELPKTHFDNLDFSFSGIKKTAVINIHHKTPDINKADLCASFEKTVTEILIEHIKKGNRNNKFKNNCISRRSICKFIYKKSIFRLRKGKYKSVYARFKIMYR